MCSHFGCHHADAVFGVSRRSKSFMGLFCCLKTALRTSERIIGSHAGILASLGAFAALWASNGHQSTAYMGKGRQSGRGPLLKTKVEQDFIHLPVLPDKLGKFYVPLFELKSGTRTAPAPAVPRLKTRTSQPPSGRPIPASSESEMRTCILLLLPLTLSEAF